MFLDNTVINQQLQTAATQDPTRSQTARLLDYLDSIETALNSGVSRASVIQILSANGFASASSWMAASTICSGVAQNTGPSFG